MKNINTSGRHLQQIINDILDLSKIEAGKMDLHVATYPVSYFEDAIRRVLSAALAAKTIDLRFELAPEIEELVVDQTRFKQILINLVSNAVKFSREGGVVTVRSARVGNDIRFTVRTTASASSRRRSPGLFRPFRQAESGKARTGRASGSGWRSRSKLVELHGGTIWVESEWGKGTTVLFRIPMVVDVTSEQMMQAGMLLDALRAGEPPHEGGREAAWRSWSRIPRRPADLLQLHIESAGYRVEIARNGSDALEMAKRLRPIGHHARPAAPGERWMAGAERAQEASAVQAYPRHHRLDHRREEPRVQPRGGRLLREAGQPRRTGSGAGQGAPASGTGMRKPTVLVIDDDRAATDLVQVILENEGYPF